MKKMFLFFLLITPFFLLSSVKVYASSSYVLPYPGVMPGNKLYKVSEIFDFIKKYYTFGDFAQYKYFQSLSDKKLVEAKTLFEYTQYPLALIALEKSDAYFKEIPGRLNAAKFHGKNIQEKEELFTQEYEKHKEVLKQLEAQLPKEFIWRDEKKNPVNLKIKEKIEQAINVRIKYHE